MLDLTYLGVIERAASSPLEPVIINLIDSTGTRINWRFVRFYIGSILLSFLGRFSAFTFFFTDHTRIMTWKNNKKKTKQKQNDPFKLIVSLQENKWTGGSNVFCIFPPFHSRAERVPKRKKKKKYIYTMCVCLGYLSSVFFPSPFHNNT